MASLPPVKLDTHEDWFNLLMTVLHQQAEQNPYEEYQEETLHLLPDCFMTLPANALPPGINT